MSTSHPALASLTAPVAMRYRMHRSLRWAGHTSWWALGLSALALIAHLSLPGSYVFLALAIPALLATPAAALTGLIWPLRRVSLLKQADLALRLPDTFLNLGELHHAPENWQHLTVEHSKTILSSLHIPTLWPLSLPKKHLLSTALSLALLGALLLPQAAPSRPPGIGQNDPAPTPEAPPSTALKELSNEWEKNADLAHQPELEKIAEELSKALDTPTPLTNKQSLIEISSIKDKLKAQAEALARQSLKQYSESLAKALEDTSEAASLAAKIRSQKWDEAAAEAEALANTSSNESKFSNPMASSAAFQKLAKHFEQNGNSQMSESMKQLAQSAMDAMQQPSQPSSSRSGQCFKKAMAGLSQSLKQQSARDRTSMLMQAMTMQLDNAQNSIAMTPGSSSLPGMGDNPDTNSNNPGSGIGSEKGDPLGDSPSSMDTTRLATSLSGQAGEGDSSIQRTLSDTGSASPAMATKADSFAPYEELSRQALHNEAIPLSHRHVIRQYFKRIRPPNEER